LRGHDRLWLGEDLIEVSKRYGLAGELKIYADPFPPSKRSYPLVLEEAISKLKEHELSPYLEELTHVASKVDAKLYLVGGALRDILIGGCVYRELDLLLEGDLERFLESAKKCKFSLKELTPFLTLKLVKDGKVFDIALGRKEIYERAGALPKVFPAKLYEDLQRRDFTINAMALGLSEGIKGLLFDPFYGLDDIKRGILRLIKPYAFIEDPTRIIRGIRLKVRFSLNFEDRTLDLMKKAIDKGALLWVGWVRIWKELEELFKEDEYLNGIVLMEDLGCWQSIGVKLSKLDMEVLDRLKGEKFLSQENRKEFLLFTIFGSEAHKHPRDWGLRFQLPKRLREDLSLAPLWRELKSLSFENRYRKFLRASQNLVKFWSICLEEDLFSLWKAYREARPILSQEEMENIASLKGKEYGRIKIEVLRLQLEEGLRSKDDILERLRKESV